MVVKFEGREGLRNRESLEWVDCVVAGGTLTDELEATGEVWAEVRERGAGEGEEADSGSESL